MFKFFFVADDAHTFAAAARRCFEHYGVADAESLALAFLHSVDETVGSGCDGPCLVPFGGEFKELCKGNAEEFLLARLQPLAGEPVDTVGNQAGFLGSKH